MNLKQELCRLPANDAMLVAGWSQKSLYLLAWRSFMNQANAIYHQTSLPHGAMLTLTDAPIQQDPEKLGGHPTIGAKRVQADVLINYLATGRTIQDFLADYDAVTKDEVMAVLQVVKQAILDGKLTNIQVRDEDSF
jgi:uncharacterized protein (DUF433 family)